MSYTSELCKIHFLHSAIPGKAGERIKSFFYLLHISRASLLKLFHISASIWAYNRLITQLLSLNAQISNWVIKFCLNNTQF